jgi:plasmid stabilization system protein ParE
MRYRLIVAPIVQSQIREKALYIARDSPENALAWENRLRTAIKGLAKFGTGLGDPSLANRNLNSLLDSWTCHLHSEEARHA